MQKTPSYDYNRVYTKGVPPMSVLHHEALLEQCYDEATEEFMTANKLDYELFRQISDHEGVMLAIEKNARRKFDDLCI